MSVVTAPDQVFFRTDEAWDFLPEDCGVRLDVADVQEEAKGLRFISSRARIDAFAEGHRAQFRPFTLFGSGDFHHLSAVWTRQFNEPFTILSFDNHPDWDIRPPYWSCGAWINRALEIRWWRRSRSGVAGTSSAVFPRACSAIAARPRRTGCSSTRGARSARAIPPT